MQVTSHTADPSPELHGQQFDSSLKKHAGMITEYLMVVEYLSDYCKEASGLPLPSVVVESQDLEPTKHQERMPVSREMSTTQDPKLTGRRSPLQSGRRDFRSKLSTRKPDFLRELSMPNVMARGRESLRAFKQTSLTNVMVTPARKPASQRSLNGMSEQTSKSELEHLKLRRRSSMNGVSEQTFKSESEHLKLRRRSSMNGVSEQTFKSESEHLKLSRRSSLNGVSDQTSKSDWEHLEIRRRSSMNGVSEQSSKSSALENKLRRRSSLNGVSERTCKPDPENLKLKRRSSIGQTVTTANFLEDDNRSRVKPCREEAADAKSTKIIASLPVHKWKIVPTTTHATRHPVMPE
jgi:hypothetical protein